MFLGNEYFWGGCSGHAPEMPLYAGRDFSYDLRTESRVQTMPMLLSSKGRVIWSDDPFNIVVDGDEIILEGTEFEEFGGGSCFRDAYLSAMKKYFPFDAEINKKVKIPHDLFTAPQFNTRMEFTYYQNQEGILKYAHTIIDNGFEPGVIMIDSGWQKGYGLWDFDRATFPDPKAMVDELHSLGFKVMLWVVPFVTSVGMDFLKSTYDKFSPDTYDKQYLRNKNGDVACTD